MCKMEILMLMDWLGNIFRNQRLLSKSGTNKQPNIQENFT